ncbi:unnamed protein product [Fraxinus pennsylvanica]|uniref:Uncharacterized protein n=1 Tax=Fraxinus pennsylvanica TaxID=56036 RepID=A0AAD1ZSF7_9LAMI|nr:unnamed protein product [Fraxinus pennsylvanica]
MSETIADSLVVEIDMMLSQLRSVSPPPSEPSMFRVDDRLRSINPKAYDPEIIAIGPFHRGKRNLQEMELHKVRARQSYEEDIDLDKEKFLQMLIFDGGFIIEFLYLYQHEERGYEGDPIFQHKHIQSHLLHDLLLFENQIPFFIVECLFNMIDLKNGDNIINSLIYPLLHSSIFPVPREDLPEVLPVNALHLLGIVHDIQCSSFATVVSLTDAGNPGKVATIYSAVELEKAGISIQKSEYHSLLHIEFENKAMKIAELKFSDSTEWLFRNLIAYEYYLTGSPQKYVTDYVFFMHCLVRFPEDTKLLRRRGIVSNLLERNDMAYHVIKRLSKKIIVSEMFSYSNIFNNVNHHRRSKWNTRMATLRRNYLKGPRALISVFVATFLLVLIILVTFGILSYCNDLEKGN